MNNQSDKPEKLEPQDSKQKKIKHSKDDNEAVVQPADRVYLKEEADFGNTAEKRKNSEQPVRSDEKAPKNKP